MLQKLSLRLGVLTILAVTAAREALAQVAPPGEGTTESWTEPMENTLERITDGLIEIGIPVLGIGLALIGLWAGATGNIRWERVLVMVIGGMLMFFGGLMAGGVFAGG